MMTDAELNLALARMMGNPALALLADVVLWFLLLIGQLLALAILAARMNKNG